MTFIEALIWLRPRSNIIDLGALCVIGASDLERLANTTLAAVRRWAGQHFADG